jgi:outer membrane protein
MNWNRAGSWMTFAMAATLGGCISPGGLDGNLIGRYQQAVAERAAQPRQAVTGIGSLKPAQAYVGSPLAAEDTVVSKVLQIDETYKVVEKYDNGTEKVDLIRVVTTTTNEKDPNTGKVAPVVKVDKRGPCSVVYGSAPVDVHQVDTYRVGAQSGAAAIVAGDHKLVKLSLDQAILRALANSLDIRVVSYDPAIAREDMVRAAAAFDYTLFGATDLIHAENKQANGFAGSISKQRDWSLGVKQHTVTGADFSLQWAMTRAWDNSGFLKVLNTHYEPTLVLQVTQPLLRNAWPGFNLAQLRIARVNARVSDAAFRDKVEEVITQVVSLYWTLIQARQSLQIQRRLLDQTQDTYGITLSRYQVDATGAVITQLQASVKIREAGLITARKNILDVQQALARLLNDPQLNSLSDCEVVPTTPMVTEKLEMDPVDQMLTALMHNPQLEQARLGIAASEINVSVARNQTLPKLDLSASAGIQDLAVQADRANRDMLDADYASYSIGLAMEYPIGNRDRLANLRQRKFERTKAIVTMQNAADQIAVSIQERIRQIGSSHDQIVAQHAAVKASEAQLSAIEVTEKVRARLTPEFLQLKLQVQQTLASSQQAELQAMVDYNNALADLARITGTILDQHRVEISMSQVVNGQWTPATPTTTSTTSAPAGTPAADMKRDDSEK